MSTVYLGLGTNLGDKEVQLRTAVNEIEKRIGRVMTLSAFYTT
ncbi:MAG: 2-amino-4-hydroxy-6-hydroxymethyldihydropteridine diphosphokinase, partial [Phocaeicola sp.]|nr:2-amino-4-hydroxy-6-hydroxymethyldihydropteridine diphosphokinase [Phocaeicola sp.]